MIKPRHAQRPILIAGGGVGGLTAAIALAQKGYLVTVLEQAEEIKPIGYGIQLGPNAFHMFERLGLARAMLAHCTLPEAGVMRDIFSSEEITRLPMGKSLERRYGHPYAVIHRGDLHQVLLDACRAQPTLQLRVATHVEGFEDCGDHVVVQLASGETLQGAALIGADGVKSIVREQLTGPGNPLRELGYTAYRAVHSREAIADDLFERNVTLWAGPGYHLMLYPLRRDTLFNIVAVFRSRRLPAGLPGAGEPDELHEIFAPAHDRAHRLLELVDTSQHWAISVMEPVAQWCRGRVALLGDAAHAMLQAMAQGACQAIEDGVWLAEFVHLHGDDLAGALQAYQQGRQLRAVRLQYQSRFYWEVFHAAGVYADLRRQLLTRTPEQAIESLAWLYERQPFPADNKIAA